MTVATASAARAVIELAFGKLGMHRLFGDCDPQRRQRVTVLIAK
jgi:hypothetical protein